MHSAITSSIGSLLRAIVAMLVIAIVIMLGQLMTGHRQDLRSRYGENTSLLGVVATLDAYRTSIAGDLTERTAALTRAPLVVLDRRIAELDKELNVPAPVHSNLLLTYPLPNGPEVASRLASELKRTLLREVHGQEREYLQQLRAYGVGKLNYENAVVRLEQLRRDHQSIYQRYLHNEKALAALGPIDLQRLRHPWLQDVRLGRMAANRHQLGAENARAFAAYEQQRQALARIHHVAQTRAFVLDQVRLDTIITPLKQRQAWLQSYLDSHWLERYREPYLKALHIALYGAAISAAVHFAFKAMFFFVLAPLAARRPPLVLDPHAGSVMALPGQAGVFDSASACVSRVAQSVMLDAGETLLVLPDYLQSAPVAAIKDTKWLLDWRCPLTSLIAGMVALTRVRTDRGGQSLVLSSSQDPLCELALLALPRGTAMVFQPRALVGVIYPSDSPLVISRQWRLGSLHAWLTMQLRYLVFRGPVTLVVSGTRGVRVEEAGDGRAVSQKATLGFSAGVSYATVRCDTFWQFYRGRVPLLQDVFYGKDGYYVVDETPAAERAGGLLRRPLFDAYDAALKLFGV